MESDPIVEIGAGYHATATEECASADEERAQDGTNRTRQSVHRDRACRQKTYSGAERRRPALASNDPTSPQSNPRNEHRGDKSTEDSTRPETPFTEPMTEHRSECAANPTESAGNKKESSALHGPSIRSLLGSGTRARAGYGKRKCATADSQLQ